MTRLAFDPNNFATLVKGLQTDIDQIKAAQRSGQDVFTPHVVQCHNPDGTPTAWDLKATWDGVVGDNAVRYFIASMVADHQDQVFAIPLYICYYGTPGVLPPSGNAIAGFSYLDFDAAYNSPKQIAYTGHFGTNNYPDNNDVYMKVYFYATDTGTLTVAGNP